jgi:dGTPase
MSLSALEGLAKHNGPVRSPGWAMSAVDAEFPLDLSTYASLEAQVAAVADDIAYDNHDIDDGLRAGLLDFDELIEVPFVAQNWAAVLARFPDVVPLRLRPELIRHQIGVMVNDVIETTKANLSAARVSKVDDVRAAGRTLAGFSDGLTSLEGEHKQFMYAKLYRHPVQLAAAESARVVVSGLFAAYVETPDALPDDWRKTLPRDQPDRARHIADFIAGMTDRYAVTRYREVVGEVDLPEGF